MHYRNVLKVCALGVAYVCCAHGQESAPLNTAMTDQDFIAMAASSDEFERESGTLATERAQHTEVAEFGERQVIDHTRSTEALMAAAQAAGLEVPSPQLHLGQQRKLEALSAAPEGTFDQQFLQVQVVAHAEALLLMQACVEVCEEASLREFASATAPVIEAHLEQALELQRELDWETALAN